MKLEAFQVKDFRSINDSGKVELEHRTVLVGRNESGKSSLLKVLSGLKPPGDKLPEFALARDFPRDRPRRNFKKEMVLLHTWWELDDADRAKLGKIWPRASVATGVEIDRAYEPKRYIGIEGTMPLAQFVKPALDQRKILGKAAAPESSQPASPGVSEATQKLIGVLDREPVGQQWGTSVLEALKAVRGAVPAGSPLAEELLPALAQVERIAGFVAKDDECAAAARTAVVQEMPTFVFLDEWESVPGHHDIPAYPQRVQSNNLREEDKLFAKLLKVAELDAAELQRLLTENHEERKLLTNRAGRVLTRTLRELWKDRQITVELHLDERHFDVLVSDVDTQALVPFDERSRGFRWYFSFFVTFAADTQGGDKANAILLLDEPGLFLHATAQGSLLAFFDTLKNQIIYTTHSPFMVDPARIASVRTVNLTEGEGTTVSAEPTGDANTLFPLQAALGYDLTQTLFVGSKTVVVEGVTDYWYLATVSDLLLEKGRKGLTREVVLTPAGGAPKVPYMVALLTAQNLKVAVLLDSEPKAEATAKELVREKLIRSEGVVHIGSAFQVTPAGGADIEDLLDPDAFVRLVEESYAKELAGKKLSWNTAIPRIVNRAHDALKQVGIDFQKTRPARLFLRKAGADPSAILSDGALDRFEQLIALLNGVVEKFSRSERRPFE